MSDILLEIKNLTVSLRRKRKDLPIVKGVDIDIPRGQIIGLVGESGCGKSMTARSVMGILPPSASAAGSIIWHDQDGSSTDLLALNEKKLRKICGAGIGMIFQEPMSSLNPMMRIGDQVAEALLIHKAADCREAKDRVISILKEVGIPEPAVRYRSYPHELSGGMRQRVMIAMAMICEPGLLIADEPTTALDVTTESQILKLIRQMCETRHMSALVITHNMGVVSQLCDRVYVMYMGRIMERAPMGELFSHPMHPYTQGLLSSIPRIGANPEYLETIPSVSLDTDGNSEGCEFCLRCSRDDRRCFFGHPSEDDAGNGHYFSCFNPVQRTEGENE